jgi:hypothetical protein
MNDKEQLVRPIYDGYNPVLEKSELTTNIITNINNNESNILQTLQNKYDLLVDKYKTIQNKIKTSVNNAINVKNNYAGKNIKFTNNVIGYVTQQGIFRKYPNRDVFDAISGKNGCPTQIVNVNINWSNEYIEGSYIPTQPPLLVGRIMTPGESCGYEGNNVYVTNLNNNPTSNYVGCYNDNVDNPTMTLNPEDTGYTTFDKCQSYAANNGYSYFGLQNVRSDGTASCYLSNDINTITSYGDATNNTSSIAIWSSNTSGTGATLCYVNNDGRIILNNANGDLIWQSSNSLPNCVNGGNINKDTLTATYGANCNSSGYKVAQGNATNTVKGMIDTTQPQSMIPIGNSTFGDPSPGCAKGWDTAYQCGTAWKSTHIDYAEGQNFVFDCTDQINQCTFYLILQTDGNMCLYTGQDPSSSTNNAIWCSSTNGKQNSKNPNWVSSNGKFGRSYMKLNESLGVNEWIGSDDGTLKLIMQSDGNLVLYTSQITNGCQQINNITYGKNQVNAVYQINEQGNNSLLGKLGFITNDSELKEYPDSMIGFVNDYQIFQNSDSPNNDITTSIASTMSDCQNQCNGMSDCAGYVYQQSSQTCWLKNNQTYPKAPKTYNSGTILGVRKPNILSSSSTCGKKVFNIDSLQYGNYNKKDDMTPETNCGKPIISESDKIEYNNVKNELGVLGNLIANKTEELYNRDSNLNNTIDSNNNKFKKDIINYKLTNLRINKELSNSNIEGMKTMNDLNGMLKDSDLRVLQSNYSYIMWSMFAIGALTITINTMSK